MLPTRLRHWLFDRLSVQTMRYVTAVPARRATGLTRDVYEMIREDFFRNGSLTSRSRAPELMAAIWTLGREAMLVEDRVDRTTKDAMAAVLSQLNDCPYCEDMLISLVHAAGDHDAAGEIFEQSRFEASPDRLRRRLEWVRAVVAGDGDALPDTPFTEDQLPEVLGTLMGMTDINRYSHVVMASSPVSAPFGLRTLKAWALRVFGGELRSTRAQALEPGRALDLLPPAELPEDLRWAEANPRVAAALARWVDTLEREAAPAVPPEVRRRVTAALERWKGEEMPLDSGWIRSDIDGLEGRNAAIARLAIVLAKAHYRVTDRMVTDVLGPDPDEAEFVRILAWASYRTARRVGQLVSERIAAVVPDRTASAA